MNNGLLYLGGLLAVLLAALFGGPYLVDWNGYRGVFEEEASKILGRDVRVGGAVNVRFLPTPYVRFEKVRLADPSGQTGEPFLRADSFTMRLAVSPLLRGAFEANEIELTKPVLSLVLDGHGGGNWTSLELKPADLPFIPQNVALHSVRLVDGALGVRAQDGSVLTRLDGINGELAAETLKGPFKFKGAASVAGAERDLKFATQTTEADGSVRFKASVHGPGPTTSFIFDGKLESFTSAPRISGELTGKFGALAPEAAASAAADNAASGAAKPAGAAPLFNLKSDLTADASGASLKNIEIDLDSAAEPQIISGTATAVWNAEPRIDTALNAKWLDLDQVAGRNGEPASFDALHHTAMGVINAFDGFNAVHTRLEVEQVKFAGEQAGSLILDSERVGSTIKLRELKSGLPGGARFEIAGDIKADTDAKVFTGEGSVRGVNIARTLAFLQKSGIDVDLKADGPFWVAGEVETSEKRFALKSAKAEIAGTPLSAEITIDRGDKRAIALRIDSAKLDTASFFPAEARHVQQVVRRAFGLADQSAEPAVQPPASRTSVRIATGELKHDGKIYRDVDVNLVMDGDALDITNVALTTDKGATVRANGNIKAAKGEIAYAIDAPKPESAVEAGALVGLAAAVGDERLGDWAPTRLAGLLRIGNGAPEAADVSFDGTAAGARVSGNVEFDGGFKSWRTAPSRITMSSKASDLSSILGALGVAKLHLKGFQSRPGNATIAIAGAIESGARTFAQIEADGLATVLNGTLSAPAGKPYSLTARAQVKARDARELLALVGVPSPSGMGGVSLDGTVDVATTEEAWNFTSNRLKAGLSTLTGSLSLGKSASGGVRVSGDVQADRVLVSSLFGWIDEGDAAAATDSASADAGGVIWPQAVFNFEPLDHIEGDIRLRARSLELAEGLVARDSDARIAFERGKVALTTMKARAGNGTLNAAATLAKDQGSVALDGKFALVTELTTVHPAAKGRATVEFSATSRAPSAAALVAALAGKGTVKLEDARQPGPSSALVVQTSDAVLAGKLNNDVESIVSAIKSGLASSEAIVGSRTIPLTIVNGDVKVEPFTIDSERGPARVTTTVSLASLLLDSVWQVTALPHPLPPPPEAGPDWRPAAKGPLPAVAFAYTGPLGDVAQVQVAVDATDLQRELGVRQMERKVEELDVLRRRDEERQRQEVERRKQVEAERAGAAAAAAAARAQAAQHQPPEQLPPVIPESAEAPEQKIVPQAGPPDGAPSPNASATPRQVTIEPISPADAEKPVAPAAPRVTVAPAPRPQVPPRTQRPARTTADEINRAFGSWP